MHPMRMLTLMLLSALPVFAQQAPLPGTIDVTTINTNKLLALMNAGDGHFVPVAAHRGSWRDVPENSLEAIQTAYDAWRRGRRN